MQENQIKNACAFYVNHSHLSTMILPYIHQELKKKHPTITILEEEMEANIEELLSKMNLKQEEKQEIREINWKQNQKITKEELENNIKNLSEKFGQINIVLQGGEDFLEKMNLILDRRYQYNKSQRNPNY